LGSALARLTAVGVVVAVAAGYALLHAQPSHADTLACEAPFRGFDFDTYELENYKVQYGQAIELAAAGKAVPAPYTLASGETIDVHYQGLESGPRSARTAENTALAVPPTVYKSIVWIESNYANANTVVPYGGVGPLLVSGDCGYGLGQITSGMGALGSDALEPGVPSARQAIIGTDFLFNLSEGVRILAGKWNGAPQTRPIAGNGDPSMLEDWYFAIWSYNGFAFSNHPLNPNLDPMRGGGTSAPVYHCGDPASPGYVPIAGGLKYGYGSYTYPERVYGCMRYPPKLASSVSAAADGPKFVIGDKAIVFGTGDCLTVRTAPGTNSPRIAPEPGGCLPDGSPVTITGGPQVAGAYTWWKATTSIGEGWMAEPFLAKLDTPPVVDPANRMWPPQTFNMPNLALPAIAEAFTPEAFTSCDGADFAGGCPAMDFPTTIADATPPIAPHHDTTPPVDVSLAGVFLGDPRLEYSGPTTASLQVSASGATSVQVTVMNTGRGIAPFRIRTSAGWLVARHPGDPPQRTLDGGVAIGTDMDVVTAAPPSSPVRVAKKGYQSVLTVTIDPAAMPPGTSTAVLYIEPLLGSGSTFTMSVSGLNTGTKPLAHRVVAPNVAGDG
jgi:hypothetical protein